MTLKDIGKTLQTIFQNAGSALDKGLNTNFLPGQKMPISQAIGNTFNSPHFAQDFANVATGRQNIIGNAPIQKPFFDQNPITKNILDLQKNTAQTVGSGVQNIFKGGYQFGQSIPKLDAFGALQGGLQTVGGAGKVLAAGTPLFQVANLLTKAKNPIPIQGVNIPLQNISKGVIQGMTGEKLAPYVQDKNIKIGKLSFDPYQVAGNLYGFTQNPVNKKVFEGTNKLLPSENLPLKQWLVVSASRGGLDNLFMTVPDMPQNLTPVQKLQYMGARFGEGALMNIAAEGFARIAGKLAESGISKKDAIAQTESMILRDVRGRFAEKPKAEFKGQWPEDVFGKGYLKQNNQITDPVLQTAESRIKLPETPLTPEQLNSQKKLPGVMYSVSKTKAEGKAPKNDTFIQGLVEDQNKPYKPSLNNADPLKNTEINKNPLRFITDLEQGVKQSDVKNKVSILDYFRTPQKVLEKIGLGKEGQALKTAYESYQSDLEKEIGRISEWQKQVPSNESAVKIFQYLDGKPVELNQQENKVAEEIKPYLKSWAEKLRLPEDKQISHYITHIFERNFIQKEFDPEIAKIIQDKVPGSVYDPFLQERLGKQGYVENVWRALDAYVKRATRKVNMDPALEKLSASADKLPIESWNYVKRLGDRINMRPTEIDNLIDNLIKQSPVGYRFGQRPFTALTQKFRQAVYRGALGLNFGSALRNLSQGVNTYAELGEKYTAKGYLDMFTKGTKELEQNGILRDNVIQDRQLNVLKKGLQRFDEGLFYFFDLAERINRGSAYFGAKAKALSKGMNEAEAINYARNIVEKTQFKFDSVDTPVALSSDLAKTLAQFQSYTIKQAEFLGGKIKAKEYAGLIRYALGTFVVAKTIGKLYGFQWTDVIPSLRMESPLTNIVGSGVQSFSPDEQTRNQARKDFLKNIKLLIPAGSQLDKTIQGIKTVQQGYSENSSGKVQYPVANTAKNRFIGAVFGKNNLPETRQYYDTKQTPLSDNQSQAFKTSSNPGETYNNIIQNRIINKQIKDVGKAPNIGGNVKISNLSDASAQAPDHYALTLARTQLKNSADTNMTVGNVFLYKDEKGSIHQVSTDFSVNKPQLTGNTTLDKKLISSFNGKIASKANDILELYNQGQLTASQADNELNKLNAIKSTYSAPKKPKKITIKMPKLPKLTTNIKFAKLKLPKSKKLKLAKIKALKTPKLKIA